MNSSISTSSSTSSSSSTSFPLNLTLLIQTPYQVQPLRFHATAQVNDLNPNHEFMNKLKF
ncbi:hypothetical protein HMI55_001083 [Coelomomyces lativittatus]|nr:hypothetical protein HMI55_001083 [Coelomomyces lativittatus]